MYLQCFSEKYTVEDHISNTKLEKGDHYYIQTRDKDLFSHYNLILRKNVPKSARKYKRNVLNMATVSVKRCIVTSVCL